MMDSNFTLKRRKMDKKEAIENLTRAFESMETKFSNMENEINQLSEDRQQLDNTCRKNISVPDSEEKNGVLLKRIQILEEANKDLSEDLQEWKGAYDEKAKECEQNRDKYLRAQQSTEELRRQLDAINREGAHGPEQVNSSLQLANERFKEQLGELGRLPFVLEAKQLQLQETQTKLKLAEKTITALSGDLESCIVKCELLQKSLEQERAKTGKANQEATRYQKEIEEWKMKYDELEKENGLLLKSVEKMKFLEECLNSKTTLAVELNKQIDLLKSDHTKHIARIKERADTQKRAFQTQISGIEQELMQLRMQLNRTHKDRDDMKQRMQKEISKLEQKLSGAQMEIQNLKSHVDILKSSYTNMMDDPFYGDESGDDEVYINPTDYENDSDDGGLGLGFYEDDPTNDHFENFSDDGDDL